MKVLRNIKISNSENSVMLREDSIFEITHEEVGTTKQMASGKIVRDVVGYRPVLNIPVGYLSVEDVRKLKQIINSGEFATVEFPGLDGDASGSFIIAPPIYKGVIYGDNGVDVWIGMQLTCRAQEVN